MGRSTTLAVALSLALGLAATAADGATFLCYGDSITHGAGGTSDSAYLPHLARYLDETGQPGMLINRGVPGDTTVDALARLPSALAASGGAELVLLLIGTNDLTDWRNNPSFIDPVRTRDNIDDMVTLISASGRATIIATVPPRLSSDGVDPTNELTRQLNGIIRDIAGDRDLPVAEVNANLGQVANQYNYRDSIHPDGASEALVAEAFAAALTGQSLGSIDLTGPVPILIVPEPDSLSAPLNTNVEITVRELANSVDAGNALFVINGSAVVPQITTIGSDVRFVHDFAEDLDFGRSINVEFEVSDLDVVPNTTALSYSFSVAAGNGTGGDIDGSGRVDGRDLSLLAQAFGSSSGDSDYQFEADIDGSGQVDGFDLSLLAANFGGSP